MRASPNMLLYIINIHNFNFLLKSKESHFFKKLILIKQVGVSLSFGPSLSSTSVMVCAWMSPQSLVWSQVGLFRGG